jgi:HEAT repeat protein
MALFRSKKNFERYISQLKDRDPDVRRRAAKELADLGDKRAIPPLVNALSDGDKKVRWRVAYALGDFGEMGSEEAFKALVSRLEIERDWNVRRIIVMTFRHWDKRAVKPLIDALKDESAYVRRYAAMTLGFKKSKEAVGGLKQLLEKEESKEVRDYAKWALGKIEKSL